MNIFKKKKVVRRVELRKSDDGIYSVFVGHTEVLNTVTTDDRLANIFFQRVVDRVNDKFTHTHEVVKSYDSSVPVS